MVFLPLLYYSADITTTFLKLVIIFWLTTLLSPHIFECFFLMGIMYLGLVAIPILLLKERQCQIREGHSVDNQHFSEFK